jgi:hypothetical protein
MPVARGNIRFRNVSQRYAGKAGRLLELLERHPQIRELNREGSTYRHFLPLLPQDKTPEDVRDAYRVLRQRIIAGVGNAARTMMTAGIVSSPSRTSSWRRETDRDR